MVIKEWIFRARNRFRPAGRGLALALQGGGVLGAFTWGVLDRLFEEDLPLVALTGTSAGAVNAVVAAAAWTQGGGPAARDALDRVWGKVAEIGPFQSAPWPVTENGQKLQGAALDLMTRMISPYTMNPFDRDPLRDILAGEVDFAALTVPGTPRVRLAATRIADGTARIFSNAEIGIDALIASTALPLLHHAVAIDGEHYWDGGFVSNPPLLTLLDDPPRDLVIVPLNPALVAEPPRQAQAIIARVNQIVFNRPMLDEIARLPPSIRVHLIAPEPALLQDSSPLALDAKILNRLKAAGRAAAGRWLAEHWTT
jgi:NTE family protein